MEEWCSRPVGGLDDLDYVGDVASVAQPLDKEIATLYVELAEALNIGLLETSRTHVWRATLNSLLLDTVPEVIRAAFFGHDAAMNRTSYADLTDASSMVTDARKLRAV